MNRYADALDSLMFVRLSENYFAQEIRSSRREEAARDMADKIAAEVIADTGDRRATFAEEIVDNEAWLHFVRDLLDDVKAGIDPTDTIKRRVQEWALDVAEYEIERGEHD